MAVLVAAFAVACGGDNGGNSDPGGAISGGEIDYSSLSGDVRVDGSSTVYPISEAMAEEFSLVSDVRVNVASSGTGGGFEKFCRGETEISDASRPIQQDEIDACAANGIDDIVEIQVAIDALTVMVHPENDWVDCMTVEELNLAFRAGGATTWADINPEWPAENIILYYPGTDSGTFDYFNEVIMEEFDSDHRGDGTASENDNQLAQGIQGDHNALGYFGFAYFLEAGQSLKALEIDGGEGCVAPSFEAALDGSYQPLSRPLFIYTSETLMEERPEVLGFVNFYLESQQAIVPQVGYITLPDDQYQEQIAKLEPFLQ